MIFTESTIKISNNVSKMDSTIVLYRGDKNVEIRFTILQSPFKYSNTVATNVIESTNASFGQLVIKTPNDKPPIFSEVSATKEGTILFTITKEMIDEIEEVGVYTFQIRLMDENKQSRVTIPPVENGIEIKEPIAIEDDNTTNVVGLAKANYAVVTSSDVDTPTFDDNGKYNKTNWNDGDLITNTSLNKIEEGIYTTNENVTATKKYVDDKVTVKILPVDYNKNYATNVADLEPHSIYMSPNDAKFLYLAYEKLSGSLVGFLFTAKAHGRFIYTGVKDDTKIEIMMEGSCYTVYFKTDTVDAHVEKTVFYLTKNNTTEFTPSNDYEPATKKYVDDIKTGIDGIKADLGTEELTTNAKNLRGAVNELNTQYKDIANKIESGNIGNNVEPLDDDLPNVYITGTLPTSKSQGDLPITIHYISKTLDFKNYGTLKVQGASSAGYPKKNFTLKLYEDKTLTTKVKRAFKNWGKLNKFVLKAHWMDCSHVRNVGTAKIWGKIAKSRSDFNTLPEEFKNSPNAGATDGFTIRVFVNGIYHGLYEWIVPKDKLFGQDGDNVNHSIATTELNNQPSCAFATTTPTINANWSEELQDTMSPAISTSLTNFIKFVAGSTDEDFVANAENYFDVQSVIDYTIFARIFCIVDNLCRNQIFFTYDGTKWYEGVWDLDAVLGLPPTTRGFYAYNTEYQNGYVAYHDYQITNMLYKRVETLFMDRFKTRYKELRADILSIEGILDVYEKLTNVIKTYDGLLEEDYAATTGEGKFTAIPYQKENNIQQIRTFIAKRLIYMDECVNAIHQAVPCTNITLDKTELTITGTGESTTKEETINTTYVVGYINRNMSSFNSGTAGTINTSSPNDRTTDFIDITNFSSISYTIPTSAYIGAVAYDSNKKYLKAFDRTTWIDYITTDYRGTTINIASFPENAKYIRFTSNTTDTTNNVIKAIISVNASQHTLTATLTPTNTTDKVVWSVSPTGIVTVQNGVVTAIKDGNCIITATCGAKSATCSVTVTGIEEQPVIGAYVTDQLYGDYDLRQLQTDATTVDDLSGNNNTFNIDAGTIQKDDKGGLISAADLQITNNSFNPQTANATLEYTIKYTGINDCGTGLSFNNRTCGIVGHMGAGYYMWLGGASYCIYKNKEKIIADTPLATTLINGQYYHVVVTYTETNVSIYINNKLLQTYSHTIGGIPAYSVYYMSNTGGGGCPAQTLYSARFYNKALTTEEISQNYQYEFNKLGISNE